MLVELLTYDKEKNKKSFYWPRSSGKIYSYICVVAKFHPQDLEKFLEDENLDDFHKETVKEFIKLRDNKGMMTYDT